MRSRMKQASSEEVKKASGDPLVREAMELFDGSLVNVEKMEDEHENDRESA